jgi:hypothetical protein
MAALYKRGMIPGSTFFRTVVKQEFGMAAITPDYSKYYLQDEDIN